MRIVVAARSGFDDARKRGGLAVQRHGTLAAPHDVLGLVTEAAALGADTLGLVLHDHATPGEPGALQRIGGER